MSPEINDIIMALKAHAALYWNLPLIKANKEVYIGAVLGTGILMRMLGGPLKLGALVLGFFTPYLYFTYFA
ncbi:MAG: hypothetical protein DI537_05025 [Stutzerimonas stutzeri]|nr:MAG: hypothetical protein DI537_05025 [Stutzerimonas stutzeri]